MIPCLYCGEKKPKDGFNREHVIPQAFGLFRQNFVLKIVCRDCNSYFGNNLDNVLSRDSMEGVQRFESGLQTPTPKHRLGRGKRVKPTLRGQYEGALLEWVQPQDGSPGLVIQPLPQIGVAKDKAGPFTWYTLHEMPTLAELRESGIGKEFWLRPWNCTEEEARQVLREKGFSDEIAFEPPEEGVVFEPYSAAEISVSGVIDDITARAIAKIAFNYLAFHFPGVARSAACESIRRFIRYGGDNWRKHVRVTNERMVKNVPENVQLYVHLVAATWERNPGRLIGQVSLFNWVHYKVLLGTTFLVQPEFVRMGHSFDPANNVIMPLTTKAQKLIDLSQHIEFKRGDPIKPRKD